MNTPTLLTDDGSLGEGERRCGATATVYVAMPYLHKDRILCATHASKMPKHNMGVLNTLGNYDGAFVACDMIIFSS